MRMGACVVLLSALLSASARADTFTERWYLAAGGIEEGENAYADRAPGPDRLPYTDDDVGLPEDGNAGGTWSFGFLDVDGDGQDEHVFSLVRRTVPDDDMFTLASSGDFAHGVIAEGELWVDAHHALNGGPAGADPDDDDFEWNDSPGWDSENNWFWYNNARADQRGLGGSRYYLEYRDPFAWPDESFDEVQGWTWNITLRNNSDDGTGVEGTWGTAGGLVVKGLFIPVSAIPDLATGELDPLFGWQDIDMADYVRDVLYPKLMDGEHLRIFINTEGSHSCATTSALPPAFVMILQAEASVLVGDPSRAEYWDVTDDEAVFRWSSIYIKGDGPDNPPISLEPEDGRPLNLWRRDTFVRRSVGDWGPLEVGTTDCPGACWAFFDDGIEDCHPDQALRLPAESGPENTYFAMPLGRELDAMDGAVVARASVALEEPEAVGNSFELILTRGDEPVAWARIKGDENPRIGIGGDPLGDTFGRILRPAEESEGAESTLVAVEGEGYTEVELLFAPARSRLELRVDGELAHTYQYTADVETLVDKLWFFVEADGTQTGTTVDTVSVLQEYSLGEEPEFRRGDANGDGKIDIADAIAALSYLFSSGALTCLDAGDCNDDGKLDIADAISILSYLFASAEPPPAPGPETCGPDPTEDPDGDLGCEAYTSCR